MMTFELDFFGHSIYDLQQYHLEIQFFSNLIPVLSLRNDIAHLFIVPGIGPVDTNSVESANARLPLMR